MPSFDDSHEYEIWITLNGNHIRLDNLDHKSLMTYIDKCNERYETSIEFRRLHSAIQKYLYDDTKNLTRDQRSQLNERLQGIARNIKDIERDEYLTYGENRNQAKQVKLAQLPKRIYYKDIPAKVANETTDVINLRTRKRYKFQDGTMITEVNAFAGKGCSRPFRDAEKYAKRYPKSGSKAENWQHCAGKAQLTDGINSFTREVHWVQGEDRKMREAFIKEYPGKLKDEKRGRKQ